MRIELMQCGQVQEAGEIAALPALTGFHGRGNGGIMEIDRTAEAAAGAGETAMTEVKSALDEKSMKSGGMYGSDENRMNRGAQRAAAICRISRQSAPCRPAAPGDVPAKEVSIEEQVRNISITEEGMKKRGKQEVQDD